MLFVLYTYSMQLQTKQRTAIKTTFGVILIVLGLVGLIFPILPGWWVILIGLQILGFKLVIDRRKPWSKIISIKDKDHKDEEKERTPGQDV
jgi:hypothetical protein